MLMTLRGATFVRAGREAVWTALHDLDVIARCVPGCRSLAKASDSLFVLSSRIAIGPLHLLVDGSVELAESDPPRSFCLVGQGSSRALDASGRLRVDLVELAGGCRLCYSIEADARGLAVGAGSTVISGIGRGISAYFASRFGGLVEEQLR